MLLYENGALVWLDQSAASCCLASPRNCEYGSSLILSYSERSAEHLRMVTRAFPTVDMTRAIDCKPSPTATALVFA